MLDVFRVYQVFLFGVYAMEFLKVVYFVLILVVAMVSGAEIEVRQLHTLLVEIDERLLRYRACAIRIKQGHNLFHSIEFCVRGDILQGLVIKTISSSDFVGGPLSIAVEVM